MIIYLNFFTETKEGENMLKGTAEQSGTMVAPIRKVRTKYKIAFHYIQHRKNTILIDTIDTKEEQQYTIYPFMNLMNFRIGPRRTLPLLPFPVGIKI